MREEEQDLTSKTVQDQPDILQRVIDENLRAGRRHATIITHYRFRPFSKLAQSSDVYTIAFVVFTNKKELNYKKYYG